MLADTLNRDYKLIENNIEELESVISCRFVIENEEIKEIHLVSNGTRSPKQISRDVQSILIATYDLNLDYKKISIAELPCDDLVKKESRLEIDKVTFENSGKKASVKVGLSDGANIFETTLSGVNTSRNIERMLANAVLESVEKAIDTEDRFILEDIKSINLSSEGVIVVVIVSIMEDKEKRLCGSSLIENDYKKAVIKATLDSLNRCISK